MSQTEPSSAHSKSNNNSTVLTPNSVSSASEQFAPSTLLHQTIRPFSRTDNVPRSYQEPTAAWTEAKEFRPTVANAQQYQADAHGRTSDRQFSNNLIQYPTTYSDSLQSIWTSDVSTHSFANTNEANAKPNGPSRTTSYNEGHSRQARFPDFGSIGLEQQMQTLQLEQQGGQRITPSARNQVAPLHSQYQHQRQQHNAEWPVRSYNQSQQTVPGTSMLDRSMMNLPQGHFGGAIVRKKQGLAVREPATYNTHSASRQQSFNNYQLHDAPSYPVQPYMNPFYTHNEAMPIGPKDVFYGFGSQYDVPYMLPDDRPEAHAENNHIFRSPLLEEFRVNKSKKFELRDIYDHIVEFSGDQLGSRFIQQKLEVANSDEKDRVFGEIAQDSRQLMTDVFGNYVIQKMFEHGNQSQKKLLAGHMRGHVYALSISTYGCRVVQKALEHILTDQQAALIKELDGCVLKVVENQNGNHVIQKAIERIPGEHIQFIIDAHRGHVHYLAKHTYGCRVIQRMLEHCTPRAKRQILDELHVNISDLIQDPFGNYVVQHVIANGEQQDRKPVIDVVMNRLLENATHKFASNVVEKALDYADEEQRRCMLRTLTQRGDGGTSQVHRLLSHQYGNYVIREYPHNSALYTLTYVTEKSAAHLHGHALEAQIMEMEQYLSQLRRVSTGKQVAALENSICEAKQRLGSPRYNAGLAGAPMQPRIVSSRR